MYKSLLLHTHCSFTCHRQWYSLAMYSAFRGGTLNHTTHSPNFKSSGAVQRRDVPRGQFWDNHPRRIDILGGSEWLFGRKETIFPKNSERSKTVKGFQKFLLILNFTFWFVRRFKCSCICSRFHCSVSYWLVGTTSKTLFTFWRWKVTVSSETPVYIYQFTRRHIPEDSSLYQYRCENIKYRSFLFLTNLKWKTRCCYEWFPYVWILCADVSEHSVPFSWVVWTRPMKMEQCVTKRRHIKFRRRRMTQKKEYSIHNTT